MDLMSKILECKTDEEADKLIKEEINKKQNSVQPIKQIGFIDYQKNVSCYKGFIPLHTKIKYCNINIETYGMETTDFFYEFAHLIRKYNINNKNSLINSLDYFIAQYFGLPDKYDRETIFYDKAWNSTTTDKEFFEALDNNKIGDLKGTGAAQCTEYSALAQQLLNLFDIEAYYCCGCLKQGDSQDCHAFNVAKAKNCYVLLDYSVPVISYDANGAFIGYAPFMGELSEEEFIEFTKNGVIKEFGNYQIEGNKKQPINSSRKYIVGSFTIEDEKKIQ